MTIENQQIDDQVLQKSDGFPTYHLANVVDDHLMEITHVMRAEEWVTSTPKHVLLYQAFGWEAPEFIHMPLLRNQDKSKISKRKNPVSINFYKQAGFLPEALLNYLGMMGWTMPDGREKFTVEEMVKDFTLDRISLGGPVFDVQKLTWLNGLYLRELSAAAVLERVKTTILTDARLAQVMPLVHERIEKLEDFVDQVSYFFSGDLTALEAVLELIDGAPTVDAQALEASLRALADKLGWKAKDLFMPLRVAATGRRATPPLFETLAVLGKERCRRRLRAAVVQLKNLPEALAQPANVAAKSG